MNTMEKEPELLPILLMEIKLKTYGNSLSSMMKRQLKLDNLYQIVDLFKYPISEEEYNQILKEKGLLK